MLEQKRSQTHFRSSSESNNGTVERHIAFKEKPKRKTNVIRVAPLPKAADSISSSFPDSLDKILDTHKVRKSERKEEINPHFSLAH